MSMRKITFIVTCSTALLFSLLITNQVKGWMLRRATAQGTEKISYVSRSHLWPQLQDNLLVMGDRLEKPGNERLQLLGTINRPNGSRADNLVTVRLTLEYPDKLRLEESEGVTLFDGNLLKSSKKIFNKKEEDEIESLLSDSPEHFFKGLMTTSAIRSLGTRFRIDDGTSPNYKGPYYDVYVVDDFVTVKKETGRQEKTFYFNSDSQFLERVCYVQKNSKKNIEVQFSNWQQSNGHSFPSKITRLEDGAITTSLTVTSATLGARAVDGIFSQP